MASSRRAGPEKPMRDHANIPGVYANSFNVTGNREEIVFLFGLRSTPDTIQTEDAVHLTDRIILNPSAAKRLSVLLNVALRDYENEYGSLEIEHRHVETSVAHAQPFTHTDQLPEKADFLLRLAKSLDTEFGIERSFKIFDKTILANRFLMGFKKDFAGDKSHETILDICNRMNMPGDLLAAMERHLPDANYIHFGFEENERTCIYKAYLEFYEKIEKEMGMQPNACNHFLLHLGFKWDAADNTRKTRTNYTWYPFISVDEMVKRISGILDPYQNSPPFEAAKGILETASAKMPHNDILYLEVTEEGNPRKSFDVNIYRAGFQLCELYPFILTMFRHYAIPPEQARNLYASVKSQVFGHLSGGTDREGKDFSTVYYGVESIKGFGAESGRCPVVSPLATRTCREAAPRMTPPFAGVERTDKKAGMLFELVNSLGVQVGFERSFKVLQNTFLKDRFLMGFKRKSVRQESHGSIVNICREIDMPEDFLEIFQEHLPESNIVLFGFEGNEKKRLYKAYLEFGDRITGAVNKNPDKPEPFVIHMAFKWDAFDNDKKTKAEYICFPYFTVGNMLERLSSVFYSRKDETPFEIVENILNLALSRAAQDAFIYFEAEEENNPRRSFDINLYTANLRLNELYPYLSKMCRHYAIPFDEFHHLYDPMKTRIFGHLSGGIDREGRDFLTVYFGEKGSSR